MKPNLLTVCILVWVLACCLRVPCRLAVSQGAELPAA